MSKERYRRFSVSFTFLIGLFLIFSTFIVLNVSAQEENELFIVIYEHDPPSDIPLQGNVFLEDKEYDILIGYEDQTGGRGIAHNVTVTVPWTSPYFIGTDPPDVTIKAPKYEEFPQFEITASKVGFISARRDITVLKGELSVATDKGIVEEEESFQVTVTDQNENAVEGSTVYLDINGQESGPEITNSDGIAYLEAPEVDADSDITIIAFKDGYEVGSKPIRVEKAQESFLDDIAPIVVALIVVIFAMLFVRFRKKLPKPKPNFKTEIPNEDEKLIEDKKEIFVDKVISKKLPPDTKDVEELPASDKGPRVEEIRIHRPDKKKETKHISEKEPEAVISSHKKDEYEWFKGTDYMKYKIDELTGEIDEQKADKWFEGVPDIKSKVDEKLKEKKKKKDK